MSDIFREIDEELRRENLLKLWSRYGSYIIAAAVLVVLIAGGIFAWRDISRPSGGPRRTAIRPPLALARQGKEAEAAKLFADVGAGWRRLWHPGRASSRPSCWPRPATARAAIAAYDRLAASSDGRPRIPRPRGAALGHAPACPTAIRRPRSSASQPLTENGNPWRASALDLTAAAKLKAGDRGGALEIYQTAGRRSGGAAAVCAPAPPRWPPR